MYISLILFLVFSVAFTLLFAPVLITLLPILVLSLAVTGVSTMAIVTLSLIFYYSTNSTSGFNIRIVRPFLIYFADRLPPSVGIVEVPTNSKSVKKESRGSANTKNSFVFILLNDFGKRVNDLLCALFELTYLSWFRRLEEMDETVSYNGDQIIDISTLLLQDPKEITTPGQETE